MISEHRLSTLLGQIKEVQYRLTAKQNLAGQMAANAAYYGERALLPAASVFEAGQSTGTADVISHFNESEQQRLDAEIGVLAEEKGRLLCQLYEEGMPTGRWIGVGDRYVQLCGADDTSKEELRLHDMPRGHERYILSDEDPQITARRVNYAAYYSGAQKQLAWIMGLMLSVFFVASYTPLLTVWLALIGMIAVVGASATVFREGAKIALRRIGPVESVNSPWVEVMPDSGKRFDSSKTDLLSSEKPSQDEESRRSSQGLCPVNAAPGPLKSDEYRRGYAYAEIRAKRVEIEVLRMAKE